MVNKDLRMGYKIILKSSIAEDVFRTDLLQLHVLGGKALAGVRKRLTSIALNARATSARH
jgi:hypothetical protein